MLKLADISDKNRIIAFCSDSLLGSYITCRLETYGFDYDFAQYWLSENDEGINIVVSSFDSSAVVLSTEKIDSDELKQFLAILGFKSITMRKTLADELCLINRTVKQSFVYKGEAEDFNAESDIDLKQAYKLISSAIPGSFKDTKEAYLNFLSDFTFRRNRDHSRIKGITENSNVISCALTSAETSCSAIISGVACNELKRGGGYGKKTVITLAEELKKENKTVYVVALNKSAETFYEKIGFEKYIEIAYIDL